MASLYQRAGVWWVSYYEDGRRRRESLRTKDKRIAESRSSVPSRGVSRLFAVEPPRGLADQLTGLSNLLSFSGVSRVR
jgi:hypothetical protein